MIQRKYPARGEGSGMAAAESAEGAGFAELAAGSMVGMVALTFYGQLLIRKIPDRIRAAR